VTKQKTLKLFGFIKKEGKIMAFPLALILSVFPIILDAIPQIIAIIRLIEDMFSGVEEKTGKQKKALAMAILKEFFSGMKTVSTGGQLETWTTLETPVSYVVDGLASIFFRTHRDPEQGGPN